MVETVALIGGIASGLSAIKSLFTKTPKAGGADKSKLAELEAQKKAAEDSQRRIAEGLLSSRRRRRLTQTGSLSLFDKGDTLGVQDNLGTRT